MYLLNIITINRYNNNNIKKNQPVVQYFIIPWKLFLCQGRKTDPITFDKNQSFIGRADAEAEVPILWPPDAKSQLTGKDPDAGKD